MAGRGLIISAPGSGNGKTILTLGILRCLSEKGLILASAKVGPDYIDPTFHTAASHGPCLNLDTWAMRQETVIYLTTYLATVADFILVEGTMGLFDSVKNDKIDGSTASFSIITGWPIILVIDGQGQATSLVALVQGLKDFKSDLHLVGVILNRINSTQHAAKLCKSLEQYIPTIPILGVLPEEYQVKLSERHLGLVQAYEIQELENFLDYAASIISYYVNIETLCNLAKPLYNRIHKNQEARILIPPLGQRIAVAWDDAFAFLYPYILDSWYTQGAEVTPFSPLNDESPPRSCDAIYLPGGYPELYAGLLARNNRFITGLRAAASHSIIFGECGGYMVLGRVLIDARGQGHIMAGMLPLVTSLVHRQLHLGYRAISLISPSPLGKAGCFFRGHEFHYATILSEGPCEPLFIATDVFGHSLGFVGLRHHTVMGSFIHLIDINS